VTEAYYMVEAQNINIEAVTIARYAAEGGQSPPALGVSKKAIWCAPIALGPYSPSHLCAPRPSISLTLDLIALPPSPTSPSPTQASSAAPMLSIAKPIMH